jgi:hypothetical protein
MRTLKEMVNNNQNVRFLYYRDRELWYSTECGFEFPIPIDYTGTGMFKVEDKALLYMRWIRRHRTLVEESRLRPHGLEF